jgi:hypothetical protein
VEKAFYRPGIPVSTSAVDTYRAGYNTGMWSYGRPKCCGQDLSTPAVQFRLDQDAVLISLCDGNCKYQKITYGLTDHFQEGGIKVERDAQQGSI